FDAHLAPLSLSQLHLFLLIEEPEAGPIPFPVSGMVERPAEFATIGQFYHALITKITELGNGIFTAGSSKQLTSDQVGAFFDELSPITNVAEATKGIELIISQGEGTQTTPLGGSDNELAHYYQFEQIVKGRKLVPDTSTSRGYSYSGDPIVLNPSEI